MQSTKGFFSQELLIALCGIKMSALISAQQYQQTQSRVAQSV
jgi:hypothetical protein